MLIKVATEFKDDFTTRQAGERLRNIILTSKEKIVVDFNQVIVASASFFDEAFAKLAHEGWSSEKINQQISIENIFSRDLDLLRQTCKIRGFQWKH